MIEYNARAPVGLNRHFPLTSQMWMNAGQVLTNASLVHFARTHMALTPVAVQGAIMLGQTDATALT